MYRVRLGEVSSSAAAAEELSIEESEKLKMDASSTQAQRIVAALGGGKEQRETAYVELSKLAEGEGGDATVSVALECTGTLVQQVLSAAMDVVDTVEFQRACLVHAKLCAVSPVKVGKDYAQRGRCDAVWNSPTFAALKTLIPAELQPEHAMTIACAHAIDVTFHTSCLQETLDAAGRMFVTSSGNWIEDWMVNPLSPASDMSVAWLQRMSQLLLDIVQNPRDTPDLAVGGAWLSLVWLVAGRAEEVAVPLIEAGFVDVIVASLRKSQPSDWISGKSPKGIMAASIFATGWTIGTLTFSFNITQLLLDKGFVDVCFEALRAFEQQGTANVGDSCVFSVFGPLRLLSGLDLAASEALPILTTLGGMASTLQFILLHPLAHSREMGFVSSEECAIILAFAFGKQEAGSAFEFTQRNLDGVVQNKLTSFSGALAGFNPTVAPFFFRPIVHLCISDGEPHH